MSNSIKTFLTGILVVIAIAAQFYLDFKKPAGDKAYTERTKAGDLRKSADEKKGDYFVLHDCQYLDDKYNDGDSFKIKTTDGRVVEIRAYFVDAAESRDKPYDDHRKRVTEQGRYFGDLDYKAALKLGKEAKSYAAATLKGKDLTVYTSWEEVYTSGRYYAFVEVPGLGWWHEALVKKGLARIHTKGSDLPDGSSWRSQKSHLGDLERAARRSKLGGWRN